MIPEEEKLLRSTYISQLSQRFGIKEQTLIDTMNNMIRQAEDEKEKERERARNGEAATATATEPTGPAPALNANLLAT